MYENWNGNGHTHATLGWRATIYDYARWEYGTEDAAAWLVAEARPPRRRTTLVARLLAWLLAPNRPASAPAVCPKNRE